MTSPLQQTLEELFAANRILAGEGVIDGFGHVSVRNPIQSDHYFMTRSNASGPVDEAGVVELDAQSNVIRPVDVRPSIERFIHGEIYRARPDVMAVVHTHAPALIPFGVSATPLRPLYHMCGFLEAGARVATRRRCDTPCRSPMGTRSPPNPGRSGRAESLTRTRSHCAS